MGLLVEALQIDGERLRHEPVVGIEENYVMPACRPPTGVARGG